MFNANRLTRLKIIQCNISYCLILNPVRQRQVKWHNKDKQVERVNVFFFVHVILKVVY